MLTRTHTGSADAMFKGLRATFALVRDPMHPEREVLRKEAREAAQYLVEDFDDGAEYIFDKIEAAAWRAGFKAEIATMRLSNKARPGFDTLTPPCRTAFNYIAPVCHKWAEHYRHKVSRDTKDLQMYSTQLLSNTLIFSAAASAVLSTADSNLVMTLSYLSGTSLTAFLGIGRSGWQINHVFHRNSNNNFSDKEEKRKHRVEDQKNLNLKSALTHAPMAGEGVYAFFTIEDIGRLLTSATSITIYGLRSNFYHRVLEGIKQGDEYNPGFLMTKGPGYLTLAKGVSLAVLAKHFGDHYGVTAETLMAGAAALQGVIGIKILHLDGKIATAIEKQTRPRHAEGGAEPTNPQIN